MNYPSLSVLTSRRFQGAPSCRQAKVMRDLPGGAILVQASEGKDVLLRQGGRVLRTFDEASGGKKMVLNACVYVCM